MTEMTVEIQVPASLSQLGFDQVEIQRRVIEWLVISAFTESRISSGKAARLLNVARAEFLALLRARGSGLYQLHAGRVGGRVGGG